MENLISLPPSPLLPPLLRERVREKERERTRRDKGEDDLEKARQKKEAQTQIWDHLNKQEEELKREPLSLAGGRVDMHPTPDPSPPAPASVSAWSQVKTQPGLGSLGHGDPHGMVMAKGSRSGHSNWQERHL